MDAPKTCRVCRPQGGPGERVTGSQDPAMLASLEATCEGGAGVLQHGTLHRHNAIPPAGAAHGITHETTNIITLLEPYYCYDPINCYGLVNVLDDFVVAILIDDSVDDFVICFTGDSSILMFANFIFYVS